MPYRIADKHKAFKDRLSVDINCTKVKVQKKVSGWFSFSVNIIMHDVNSHTESNNISFI